MARQKPRTLLIQGIQQENRHIRELQQENRELRGALEEHQSAMELIMSKYREHVVSLLRANKIDRTVVGVDGSYVGLQLLVITLCIFLLAGPMLLLFFCHSGFAKP